MIGRISPYGAAVIIAGVLLLAGLLDLPSYRFYQLQRLVVCGVAVWGALLMLKGGGLGWAVVLGGVAYLFNPLFPYAATHLIDVLFFRVMGLLVWLGDVVGWHDAGLAPRLAVRAHSVLVRQGFLAVAATLALWASVRALPTGDASDADAAAPGTSGSS